MGFIQMSDKVDYRLLTQLTIPQVPAPRCDAATNPQCRPQPVSCPVNFPGRLAVQDASASASPRPPQP